MQKPTTIRIMLMLLYFKLLSFVVMMGWSLISFKDYASLSSSDISSLIFRIVLTLVAMLLMIRLVNRKKMFPALLVSFVIFWFSLDQIQFATSIVIVLLFFLRQTREYFRGEYVAPPSPRGAAVAGTSEGIEEEAADKATLDEPDEAPATPLVKLKKEPETHIREATPEDADTIYALMRMAFEEYRTAVPPSSALEETEESVLEALRGGSESAAILYEDDTATAMVRFKYDGDAIHFFRLSVVPQRRRRGYARQLVKWIETQGVAKGMKTSRCKVRQSVQNNLVLYQNMGYEVVDQELVVRPSGTVKTLTLEKKLWE